MFRVYSICSDYKEITDEIEKLKIIWLKNAFPLGVIEKVSLEFFNKLFIPKRVVLTVPKKKLFISLTHIGKQSLLLKKRLQNIVRDQIPFCKVEVVFSSKNRLSSFFSFKDKVPKNLKSLVLYKFTCRNCNISYIGKSIRHFQVRSSEHLGISSLTNKPYAYNEKTATTVREHIHKYHHQADSECFKLIGSASNDY